MWTDIDYMDYRRTLSLDPARFPVDKMRQMIDHLHAHQQHYIVMVSSNIRIGCWNIIIDLIVLRSIQLWQDTHTRPSSKVGRSAVTTLLSGLVSHIETPLTLMNRAHPVLPCCHLYETHADLRHI